MQFQQFFSVGYPQLGVEIAAVVFDGGLFDVHTCHNLFGGHSGNVGIIDGSLGGCQRFQPRHKGLDVFGRNGFSFHRRFQHHIRCGDRICGIALHRLNLLDDPLHPLIFVHNQMNAEQEQLANDVRNGQHFKVDGHQLLNEPHTDIHEHRYGQNGGVGGAFDGLLDLSAMRIGIVLSDGTVSTVGYEKLASYGITLNLNHGDTLGESDTMLVLTHARTSITLTVELQTGVVHVCKDHLTHVEAKDATCYEDGNVEYWYCESCGYAWLDAECAVSIELSAVILPAAHAKATHVAAKNATCTELGNIEYWYCEACGQAWLDEACTLNTNLLAVVLPMVDHIYDNDYDVDCNECGAVREVCYSILTFGGNSVSEDVRGLAFRFMVSDEYTDLNWNADSNLYIDYNNCTVTPTSSGAYKLVSMGAVLSNNGSDTYLDNVNGISVMNVVAEKVVKEGEDAPFFAIRVVNIPEAHFDTVITARSYFVYENEVGEQIVVYGEETAATYNGVLNG